MTNQPFHPEKRTPSSTWILSRPPVRWWFQHDLNSQITDAIPPTADPLSPMSTHQKLVFSNIGQIPHCQLQMLAYVCIYCPHLLQQMYTNVLLVELWFPSVADIKLHPPTTRPECLSPWLLVCTSISDYNIGLKDRWILSLNSMQTPNLVPYQSAPWNPNNK